MYSLGRGSLPLIFALTLHEVGSFRHCDICRYVVNKPPLLAYSNGVHLVGGGALQRAKESPRSMVSHGGLEFGEVVTEESCAESGSPVTYP